MEYKPINTVGDLIETLQTLDSSLEITYLDRLYGERRINDVIDYFGHYTIRG